MKPDCTKSAAVGGHNHGGTVPMGSGSSNPKPDFSKGTAGGMSGPNPGKGKVSHDKGGR